MYVQYTAISSNFLLAILQEKFCYINILEIFCSNKAQVIIPLKVSIVEYNTLGCIVKRSSNTSKNAYKMCNLLNE